MGGCCQSRDIDRGYGFQTISMQEGKVIQEQFAGQGQEHVFSFYDKLDFNEKQHLLRDASQLDVEQINHLYESLIKNGEDPSAHKGPGKLESIEQNLVSDRSKLSEKEVEELRQLGYEKIRQGKVAVVILAGGQGTRLGSDRPKGEYDIQMHSMKSIFQILTERFIKAQMLAAGTDQVSDDVQKCKLLVMTSPINHHETQKFFLYNDYFRANRENVTFFQQSMLPAITPEGKILMEEPHKIVNSPNGNGAFFDAINKNQKVKSIIEGVEYVQVIGVDNVLNKVLDPVYVGFAVKNKLQAAMKALPKRDPKEPVGVVVKKDGKYDIVEYSELSEADANRLDPKTKELKFILGNILIFILKADKLLELCNNSETLNKLYHKAFKKVNYWDFQKMELVKPTTPNAYKFELFIHNFLPFCDAGKFGVLRVNREEEFAPVKNAEGSEVDSPNTARDLIYKLNIKYLREAGAIIERDTAQIEIDHLLTYEGEGLKELVEGQKYPPPNYIKSSLFSKENKQSNDLTPVVQFNAQ